MKPQQPLLNLSLTVNQCEALRVFLERTELRGSEVPKFLEIAKAMQAAVEASRTKADTDTKIVD